MASQSSHGDGNIQALIKDSPNSTIIIEGRTTAELWVPKFRTPLDPDKNKDLDLLLAKYAVTDLTGRDALWQDFRAWCQNDPAPVSVRCIQGRGGSGKTRFALELVHHLRAQSGWDARFVRFILQEPFDLWAKTHGANHVLLVFDYAADVAALVESSLRRLLHNLPTDPKRKLRMLLLARTASWKSGWLSKFENSTTDESIGDLFDPERREPIDFLPLNLKDRIAVFGQCLKRAAEFAKVAEPPLPDPALFQGERAQETLRDPLTLMMAAVVGLRNGVPEALSFTRLGLAFEAANILVARRLARAFENEQLAHHMAAYVTLCGGLSRQEAQDALAVEARENNLGVVVDPGNFIARLQAWFPGEKTDLGPIEPDIVGEAFVLGNSSPRLVHPETTVVRAAAAKPRAVIHSLVRAIQDVSLAQIETEARKEPLLWLEQVIAKGEADDFALLMAVESELPQSSVVLRPLAVRVTHSILNRLDYLVQAKPSKNSLDVALVAERARILNNLANRQSEVGQRAEALATAGEAVTLYRELVQRNSQDNPDAFLPDLAMSLNNLANRQSEVGQWAEALATAGEAVTLYRELVQRNRDAFLPNLAMSLNNLANRQSEVGQRAEALATAGEAVTLRRELVQRNPDAFLPDLASSLNNLATIQSEVGQRAEALATAGEAVTLYRELVQRNPQDNPDAFLPDLAGSLNNLANRQSEVGQRAEALATAGEAVTLYRELVQRNPDAFAVDLARSYGPLGNALTALDRFGEAASAFADGLRTLLPDVERYPQALVGLAVGLVQGYARACEQAKLEFDSKLMAEAMRILGPYLEKQGEGDSA